MGNQAMDKPIGITKKYKVLSIEENCNTININVVLQKNDGTFTSSTQKSESKNRDLILKEFFSMKSVFKDFVNGYYYGGKCIITEDNLEVGKQTAFFFSGGDVNSVDRDICMFIKNKDGEVIASVRIENQTKIDYQMSARVLGYDGASVREQYEYPKNKMYCVNTIIINYSKTQWEDTTLNDDIPVRNGDEPFRAKMINPNLNILNLRSFTQEILKNYGNGELRLFFQIVYDIVFNKDSDERRIKENILIDDDIVVTYPTITALAIKAVTGIDTYVKLIDFYKENVGYIEGEQVKMCDVLGNYMKKTDAAMSEKNTEIATKNTSFVTYLINDNKSNKEIIDIVKDVTDDFINDIRKTLSTK